MSKFTPEIICALGVSLFVSGLIAFVFGYSFWNYLKFDLWGFVTTPKNLYLLGGILTIFGSGVAVFGLLLIKGRSTLHRN